MLIPQNHNFNIVVLLLLAGFLITACADTSAPLASSKLHFDWKELDTLEASKVVFLHKDFASYRGKQQINPYEWTQTMLDTALVLNQAELNALREIAQDSSYFAFADCATYILNAQFLVMEEDTIRGVISLGCGFSQWDFEPWHDTNHAGIIDSVGFEKMTVLLDSIYLRYERERGINFE